MPHRLFKDRPQHPSFQSSTSRTSWAIKSFTGFGRPELNLLPKPSFSPLCRLSARFKAAQLRWMSTRMTRSLSVHTQPIQIQSSLWLRPLASCNSRPRMKTPTLLTQNLFSLVCQTLFNPRLQTKRGIKMKQTNILIYLGLPTLQRGAVREVMESWYAGTEGARRVKHLRTHSWHSKRPLRWVSKSSS